MTERLEPATVVLATADTSPVFVWVLLMNAMDFLPVDIMAWVLTNVFHQEEFRLVPTSDMLLDRGMMGDGIIDLKAIRAMIEAAGYNGPQEVEILSRDNWWKRAGDEVVKTCVERYRTVC